MMPVLFLSGAGLPAWIWDDVRAAVAAPSSVAARPRGAGRRLSDYARAALDQVPDGPFAVVAHSAGGVVASEVASLAPDRVAAVLGVAAVVPVDGGSFTSSLPYPARAVLPVLLRVAGTRPPESSIRASLAAGVDDDTVRGLLSDFEPESRQYFTDRTKGAAALRSVPVRRYLATTTDAEIPRESQSRYAARLGVPESTEVASGHLPMLVNPAAVVAAVQLLLDGC